jgi:hypothetical protein
MKIFITFIISFTLLISQSDETLIDNWFDNHISQMENLDVEIMFDYIIQSEFDSTTGSGKVIFSQNKNFQLSIEDKVISFNGQTWQTYNQSSNQIIIENPQADFYESIYFQMENNLSKFNIISGENEFHFLILLSASSNSINIEFSSDTYQLSKIVIPSGNIVQTYENLDIQYIPKHPIQFYHLDIPNAFIIDLTEE